MQGIESQRAADVSLGRMCRSEHRFGGPRVLEYHADQVSVSSADFVKVCPCCGYQVGTTASVCPECGTPRERFAAMQRSRRRHAWLRGIALLLAAWPLFLQATLLALLCLARLQLGRWPNRVGADDPKGIPVVGVLVWPVLMMIVALIPAGMISLGLLGYLTMRRGEAGPGIARVWLVAAALAALGFALLILDPARAGEWLLD